ncbi:MAG: rhodanese-related sulfurtransferase [Crocinitomicaceae bacterium]|jgi:rhodanese-related sulfurtransferase
MRIQNILFIAILSFASCTESQVSTQSATEVLATDGHSVITAESFKNLLTAEDIQLIDVRTPEEFSAGTIDDAQNVDFLGPNFEKNIASFDKSKTVLIFCKSGGRSGKASKKMLEMGFVRVIDLSGGYSGWPYK